MRVLVVICLAATLSACAYLPFNLGAGKGDQLNPSTVALTEDFNRSRLIAADFAATLAQIDETNPQNLVLQTLNPSTRFGDLFLSTLQRAGYDLRVGEDSTDTTLDYNANRDTQPSGGGNPVYTFIVAAGDVKLKRSYEVDKTGVRPTGNMLISGADASYVVVDDSIFSSAEPALANTNSDGVQVSAVPAQEPLVKTRELVSELEPARNKTSVGDYSEFTNMYETNTSRYAQIFEDYVVVDENVLVFASDSLILGRQNKVTVHDYAKTFNPETDVMSVIGCSHGASKIVNGNAYLANGRAFRVKEEFLLAGLDADKVLEEGCWANKHFPKMPARGVLVQHKRLVQ